MKTKLNPWQPTLYMLAHEQHSSLFRCLRKTGIHPVLSMIKAYGKITQDPGNYSTRVLDTQSISLMKEANSRLTSSSKGIDGPPLVFLGFNRGSNDSRNAFPPLLINNNFNRGRSLVLVHLVTKRNRNDGAAHNNI
ncbi:hypothetical protein Lal_00003231 [Lupinus albus]|nr:hypothetical protein Lal_00003231 [Lupinus albus]